MKRIFIILLFPLLVTSCFADLSTEADHVIPDIVIEGVDSTMNVLYGQDIHIEARVSQEGRTMSDLKCEWSIDLKAGDNDTRIELCEGTVLDYKVSNRPDSKPYIIRLDVTDLTTGLKKIAPCKLYVASSLSEGLLVAHTRDGGASSEFDLLANKYVTYGFASEEPVYTRNLFSLANGYTLEERVNVVCDMTDTDAGGAGVWGETRFLVGTDSHIHALDQLTFVLTESDASLFYSNYQEDFATTAIFNFAAYSNAAIIGGRAYGMMCHIDRQYSKLSFGVAPEDIFRPNNVAYGPQQKDGNLAVFDEADGNFYSIIGWNLTQAAFSVLNCELGFQSKGCVCLGSGCSRNQILGFLLKDPSGVYRACMLNTQNSTATIDVFQLDGADMDKIVDVAFCDNCDLMYYTTPDALYVTILAAGRVSNRKVNWAPDSPDEKITSIRQYKQAWYGTRQIYPGDYAFHLDTHRLQMIITTYNDKTGEGKIYLRPFNVSTGLFTSKNNGTYGGFGEITALCPTFR